MRDRIKEYKDREIIGDPKIITKIIDSNFIDRKQKIRATLELGDRIVEAQVERLPPPEAIKIPDASGKRPIRRKPRATNKSPRDLADYVTHDHFDRIADIYSFPVIRILGSKAVIAYDGKTQWLYYWVTDKKLGLRRRFVTDFDPARSWKRRIGYNKNKFFQSFESAPREVCEQIIHSLDTPILETSGFISRHMIIFKIF